MKGKKLIVSALVATMVGAPVAVLNSSAASVLAEKNTNQDELYTVVGPSVKVNNGYDTKAKKDKQVTIPTVVTDSGVIADLRIIDPTGKDITTDTILTQKVFTPTKVGIYTYRINCFEGTKAGDPVVTTQTSISSTYELTLEVTGDTGSIEIPENSYYVIPTEFVKGKTLTVPVPETFMNDVNIDFTSGINADDNNGGNRFEYVDTFGTQEVEDDKTYTLKAFLLSADEEFEMKTNNETGSAYDKKAFFSWTFADNDSVIGNYKLVYKLYNGSDVVAVSNAKTIKVRSALVSDKLYISWANTPKKSANVGSTYSLVDVNATFIENSTDYVNAFTEIKVTHQATGEVMEINYKDMTFVPKYKGNYFVSYKATIPSLGISSNVLSYVITNVEDEIAPTIHFTDSYLVETTGENAGRAYVMKYDEELEEEVKVYLDEIKDSDKLLDTVGDFSHYTKSYYQMNDQGEVTITIPAAYVVDNYSKTGNMTITRNLYKKSQQTESGKLQLIKSGTSEYAYNEVAYFTFKADTHKDTSYVIKYVATDENGMTTSTDQYIYIKKADDKSFKAEAPKVTFAYDEEVVDFDGTIKFDIPTANDSYEDNLQEKTYISFKEPVVEVDANDTLYNKEIIKTGDTTTCRELTYEDINKDGDYEIDIEKELNGQNYKYIYLIHTAHNNYYHKLDEGKNYIVKKILIVGGDKASDPNAPVYLNKFYDNAIEPNEITFNEALVDANEGYESAVTLTAKGYIDDTKKTALFDQDDTVNLPVMKFTDADSAVKFDIKVSYESNGEKVELNSLGYSLGCEKLAEDSYEYTITGASFKVNYAKTYTVTIVAEDSNGNVSFVSYAVRVNDTQPPAIVVPNKTKYSKDVEIGTKFYVPAPQIIDDGETKDAKKWSYTLTTPEGNTFNMPSTSRELDYRHLNKLGTFIITYYAEDYSENSNTSSEYKINVVAKEKPVITLEDFISEVDELGWNTTGDNPVQTMRELPKATAKDVNFEGAIFVDAPTVKNSKGEEVEVTDEGDSWGFVPDVQGTYTITYSAQGKYLNSTKQYTMVIGDGEAPTLDWDNKSEDFKTTVNKGDTWAFKFDMINLDDNKDLIQQALTEDLANGLTSTAMEKISKYITIKMKNPDNEVVSYNIANNALNYTFDEVGSYTFTITLKDEAGNTTGNTYSYTITVSEEEATEETKKSNDSVVGTVLIVLSVVILAGVVAYFAITTKQVDSKSKNKKAKKEDKKDKE